MVVTGEGTMENEVRKLIKEFEEAYGDCMPETIREAIADLKWVMQRDLAPGSAACWCGACSGLTVH